MRVEIENFGGHGVVKVGDILMYRSPTELNYYLITSIHPTTKHLNDKDSYILYNLNGSSVWNIKGNTKRDILKLLEIENGVQKFTHYSQDEFKFTITKIQS